MKSLFRDSEALLQKINDNLYWWLFYSLVSWS